MRFNHNLIRILYTNLILSSIITWYLSNLLFLVTSVEYLCVLISICVFLYLCVSGSSLVIHLIGHHVYISSIFFISLFLCRNFLWLFNSIFWYLDCFENLFFLSSKVYPLVLVTGEFCAEIFNKFLTPWDGSTGGVIITHKFLTPSLSTGHIIKYVCWLI